ncbi:MAG: cobaltochelatase subunit CobT [Alphaproteobacteria bacterium]|nr:cobaltochelatase subunit CobT [Alphaproteobacteria bacterium]
MTDQNPEHGQDSETFKHVTAVTLRTIAGNRDLEVIYSPAEAPTGRTPDSLKSRLPTPDTVTTAQNRRLIRGCADAQALHFAHHDPKLHLQLAPREAEARAGFDGLEQARVEALGYLAMPGMGANLGAVLEEKCRRAGYGQATKKEQIETADVLHVLTRLALTGERAPPSAQKIIDWWKPQIEKNLGQTLEVFLGNHALLKDQKAYASLAKTLVRAMEMPLGDNLDEYGEEPQDSEKAPNDGSDGENTEETQERGVGAGQSDKSGLRADEDMVETDAAFDEGGAQDEQDQNNQDPEIPFSTRRNTFDDGPHGRYTIYTTAYDEEIQASALADPQELTRLRATLDKQLAGYLPIITKLANRLQRKVMAQQRRSWLFDLEEGILDSARLARVVANPDVPLTFKQERQTDFRDTVVSILIDNSGSMRGRPIALAAMSADIISRTLERCAVRTEILGFTTRAWKGGKSRELWVENNRPPEPGRLNDIRHIIYKSADAPMRRTRKNISLMLKEGLLKENIDGEALVWAYNRLARRPEARKILMVISDGAPVDDSTLSVNPVNILEADLRNVIRWIESSGIVELAAIGIGHDVTRYYRRALTIADADGLAGALTDELDGLFDGR